ncbi:unnamed protein product [Colias eurytheme]|nr:unnamed protein product [Colias eurytheme]
MMEFLIYYLLGTLVFIFFYEVFKFMKKKGIGAKICNFAKPNQRKEIVITFEENGGKGVESTINDVIA